MSAGKGKMKKELPARKVNHKILLGVDTRPVQNLSRPMSDGKDKQREDERRAVGPKGQTLDFIVVGTWTI